jgi:hypothetical protein
MKYKTGRISSRKIDLDAIDFAVDTALSWEGSFPAIGKGDYLVTIGHINGDPESVLVSRRYTCAANTEEAAKIAFDAFAERHGYETTIGTACWTERVDIVTK